MYKTRFVGWSVAIAIAVVAAYFYFEKFWQEPKAIKLATAADATAKKSIASKQLWTCGMHPWVIQDHAGLCPICHMPLVPMHSHADPSSSQPSDGAPEVQIDPAMVQNMGVRFATVQRGPLHITIHTVGVTEVPEPGIHDISPRVSGWITRLYADQEGMHVRADQPLFELYSPDLKSAAEELIWATQTADATPTGTTPDHKSAAALVEAAQSRLRLMGVAQRDLDAIVKAKKVPDAIIFRSPVAGAVVDKMVVDGSAVQAGSKIMRIEDHSSIWLVAKIFAGQLPAVALGQSVSASMDGLPGQVFTGHITFIHPHVDMETRTVMVRLTLENPHGLLKPGMFAQADIDSVAAADAITVPREAVIDTGTRQIVFVAKQQGHFEPRLVQTGLSGDDDRIQILHGLQVGDTVVVSGQFLLDVESRRIEAMDKFLSDKEEAR